MNGTKIFEARTRYTTRTHPCSNRFSFSSSALNVRPFGDNENINNSCNFIYENWDMNENTNCNLKVGSAKFKWMKSDSSEIARRYPPQKLIYTRLIISMSNVICFLQQRDSYAKTVISWNKNLTFFDNIKGKKPRKDKKKDGREKYKPFQLTNSFIFALYKRMHTFHVDNHAQRRQCRRTSSLQQRLPVILVNAAPDTEDSPDQRPFLILWRPNASTYDTTNHIWRPRCTGFGLLQSNR